jgi:hypothetical protein
MEPNKNTNDRQIYQMHKKGFEDISESLDKQNKDIIETLSPIKKLGEILLGEAKGDKGDAPVKGKDYFTPEDIETISKDIYSRIKIPAPIKGDKGDDGDDAVVDYSKLEAHIEKEVAKIKVPKGEPGKDAVVNYDSIIRSVLEKIKLPKADKLIYGEDAISEILYSNQFIPLWDNATIYERMEADGKYQKMLTGGGVSLNKEKITDVDMNITVSNLINDKYIVAQKGKKNYYLLIIE